MCSRMSMGGGKDVHFSLIELCCTRRTLCAAGTLRSRAGGATAAWAGSPWCCMTLSAGLRPTRAATGVTTVSVHYLPVPCSTCCAAALCVVHLCGAGAGRGACPIC